MKSPFGDLREYLGNIFGIKDSLDMWDLTMTNRDLSQEMSSLNILGISFPKERRSKFQPVQENILLRILDRKAEETLGRPWLMALKAEHETRNQAGPRDKIETLKIKPIRFRFQASFVPNLIT